MKPMKALLLFVAALLFLGNRISLSAQGEPPNRRIAARRMTLSAADTSVGTWRLNLAKSKYSPGFALKSETDKIKALDNGIKVEADGLDENGESFHVEFSAIYDGKDYPATGNSTYDTIALTRVDTDTTTGVYRKGGKEVMSFKAVVSKDGKTTTATFKAKDAKGNDVNATIVYDKQ